MRPKSAVAKPSAPLSEAQVASRQQVLQYIADFADRICSEVKSTGSTAPNLEGKATAELEGLIRGLSSQNVRLAAVDQSALGRQLANQLASSADCRLKVFQDLSSKLLPS